MSNLLEMEGDAIAKGVELEATFKVKVKLQNVKHEDKEVEASSKVSKDSAQTKDAKRKRVESNEVPPEPLDPTPKTKAGKADHHHCCIIVVHPLSYPQQVESDGRQVFIKVR